MQSTTTIAAVSTPPGPGGISIVRLSGPLAIPITKKVFQPKKGIDTRADNRLRLGFALDEKGESIDQVMCVLMKAPHTYTTEDLAEFHCHGGPVVVRKVLETLIKQGAILADPGEFTKRAFLGGRIDLSQAEAVAELIGARGEREADFALRQLTGGLAREVEKLRDPLIELLALVEAAIDFPDDEEEILSKSYPEDIRQKVLDGIEGLIESYHRGKVFREGVHSAIVGIPNVGKSSLLNALLREERAIVADLPGTTRDVIEASTVINGIPMILIDTAGLETPPADAVEAEGQKRAAERLKSADLVLLVLDQSRLVEPHEARLIQGVPREKTIAVLNKSDLEPSEEKVKSKIPEKMEYVLLSAKFGQGLEELRRVILEKVAGGEVGNASIGEIAPNMRHKESLEKAAKATQRCIEAMNAGLAPELLALEVRSAIDHLGEITGKTVTDDLLDRIFSTFCLGK